MKAVAFENGCYDVIASGSMLGGYRRASSYLVGHLDYLTLTGLDFEEFIWVQGLDRSHTGSIEQYLRARRPVPSAIQNELMAHFRLFGALGGMPEVVQTYEDTKDMRRADEVQRVLLQGYLYDIAHNASAQ